MILAVQECCRPVHGATAMLLVMQGLWPMLLAAEHSLDTVSHTQHSANLVAHYSSCGQKQSSEHPVKLHIGAHAACCLAYPFPPACLPSSC